MIILSLVSLVISSSVFPGTFFYFFSSLKFTSGFILTYLHVLISITVFV